VVYALEKDTLIYPTYSVLAVLISELGIVSSSSRGRVDFRSTPIGVYVLTLYLIQLTYPVVLPIRQCTFPYGYHTVSHHIGHIIRG
jgi:hypothetical protein